MQREVIVIGYYRDVSYQVGVYPFDEVSTTNASHRKLLALLYLQDEEMFPETAMGVKF